MLVPKEPEVELPPNDPLRRSSSTRRWVLGIFLGLLPLMVMIGAGWYVLRPMPHPDVVVEIPLGTPVVKIADILEKNGVIRNRWLFIVYNLMQDKRLQAGEYVFPDGMGLTEVYTKLVKGDVITYTIRMIEGWNARQFAKSLESASFAWAGIVEEVLAACNEAALLAEYQIEAPSCEGYLFPDTYLIQRPKDARTIVKRLLDEYKRRVTPQMRAKAVDVGLTWPQVMTLASIVEKETAAPQERPHIAGVFLNRLKKGMQIESDPTILYGLNREDATIYRSDIDRKTPYNTYQIPGLPPGPIASPSLAAIEAVLDPLPTEDLFFVSKNDGTHIFSKDYSSHAEAVRQYQGH